LSKTEVLEQPRLSKLFYPHADIENMKKISMLILMSAGFIALCAAQSPSGVNYRQEGIASWYGTEFDGRKTASGEIFDSTLYTAAHPSLPFQTVLTVTNIYNNRKVRVKVNDRGPFITGRIIDLSKAAAEAIDMISTGTAMVMIESTVETALGPVHQGEKTVQTTAAPAAAKPELYAVETDLNAPAKTGTFATAPVAAAPAGHETEESFFVEAAAVQAEKAAYPVESNNAGSITMGPEGIRGNFPPTGNGKIYRLQVGAYKIPRNAVDAFEKLKNAGFSPKYERNEELALYRVVLAGLHSEDIPQVAERLYSAGFYEVYFREE
jgi:rare lipoprotein A